MKANKQDSDDKMMKLIEYFKSMIAAITDHINTFKSSPTYNDLKIIWTLPLWSRLTGGIHHWIVDSLQKMAECGL